MPELPDVALYLGALEARTVGARLEQIRLASPFVLRSFEPPLEAAAGRTVLGLRRVGKRIVFALSEDLFLSIHLMIAGRFRWKEAGTKIPGKLGLAGFDFSTGTLLLTEASQKKRAAIHLLRGESSLRALDAGGIEPLEATVEQYAAALRRENHTIKRSLTDPRLFAGIGNAYSDEILHRARMSPLRLTRRMSDLEIEGLRTATQATLIVWIERLRQDTGDRFPEKVTAFRPEMAVHGRFRQPCPVCATPVQRIVHAENESNYCPTCQTKGKLLADRALSRLLRGDWPKSLAELEEMKSRG